MRVPVRWLARGAALAVLIALAGCAHPFGRQYEYEEQVYLNIDGSAQITIDASVPAIVALRGLPFNTAPLSMLTAADVRRVFVAAGCSVGSVSPPWRRAGRRFLQVTLNVADVTKAPACAPLAWSHYQFARSSDGVEYHQIVGAPAHGNPGAPKWDGSEIVAVKLHLPARITYHNVRRLEDGSPGSQERGNILTWEQMLTDRLAGKPIDVDVKMEGQSILYRTLWLFAGSFAAAVLVMVIAIWLTVRRGRKSGLRQA